MNLKSGFLTSNSKNKVIIEAFSYTHKMEKGKYKIVTIIDDP